MVVRKRICYQLKITCHSADRPQMEAGVLFVIEGTTRPYGVQLQLFCIVLPWLSGNLPRYSRRIVATGNSRAIS